MLKYTTAQVTFREIPDEVTLCINISNCPIHCPDCHSKELWNDVGIELTPKELERLIEANKGITCVCFMGGDNNYEELHNIVIRFYHWKMTSRTPHISSIKIALYSGRDSVQDLANRAGYWIELFNYIKIGPYIKFCGGLNHKTTNQRLYQVDKGGVEIAKLRLNDGYDRIIKVIDITSKFWKKD